MFPNQPNSSQPHSLHNSIDDHHTIDTPEQTRLEFAIAGIGSRFLALTLDLLIQRAAGLGLILIMVLLRLTGLLNGLPLSGQWIAALLIGFTFLSHFGYFTVFETLWRGQTPGKRVVHIRVVKDSGRTLSASETILRNLMRIADQLPAFYAVGILSALFTAQNQRLGDLMAGAIVVREASLAQMRPVWDSNAAAVPVSVGHSQLSDEDLALIEAFLGRRSELPGNVRSRMASGILERLQAKSQIQVDSGLSAESALETLAQGLRSRNSYL
jgi:uncharacterized RDD family membrane protein YckC